MEILLAAFGDSEPNSGFCGPGTVRYMLQRCARRSQTVPACFGDENKHSRPFSLPTARFWERNLAKTTRSSRLSAIGRNLGFGWIWMHLALDGCRQKSSGTVIDFETLSAKVICRGAVKLSYFDVTTAKTPFPGPLMPPPAYECTSKSVFWYNVYMIDHCTDHVSETDFPKFPEFAEKYHCRKRL